MKRTIGRILAVTVLAFFLLPVGTIGKAYAADYNEAAAVEIVNRIDAFMAPYIGSNALISYENGKARQCHALVNYVWKNVFSCDLYSGKSSETPHSTDYAGLGEYVNTYARPGDILRVDRQHSMVITGFDENGVTGYDWLYTSKEGKRTYTWQAVEDWGSGAEEYWIYQVDDNIYSGFAAEESAAEQPSRGGERLPEAFRNSIVLQLGSQVMTVNGQPCNIDEAGTAPMLLKDRTVLPVRAVVEAMGGKVDWLEDANAVGIALRGNVIYLTIGSNIMVANDQNIQMDAAPEILNEKAMLPIRPIIEQVGGTIEWDEAAGAVTIRY